MELISKPLKYLSALLVSLGMFTHAVNAEDTKPVSYLKDIRPIFAARCFGCHQPALANGGYSMTRFENLFAMGDRTEHPIVVGKPKDSLLFTLISPIDGVAEMPADGKPLSKEEIELISRWITEGAKDDTPAKNNNTFDAQNPPVYTQPPVVTSIDYSPDSKYLAVAGYHEVRLHNAEDFSLAGRLIGLSERIRTIRFSPDGKRLAVAGGNPAQLGEIQVWDVEKQELLLSRTESFDTLRGVSWSPDGKQIAFGATDNVVRAIDPESGQQLLFQGAPNDWPLDTVYSVDGSHLVAVGRDMTAKLIDVPHERFVDNITSITPGALTGGLHSIVRHPLRDEILVGGADGVPRVYRMHRKTKRVIGDDANLLLEFPALPGRIFGVDISSDGSLVAAGSSLNGQGALHLYRIDPLQEPTEEIKKLLFKPTHSRSVAESKKLENYFGESVDLVTALSIDRAPIYSVSIRPDGRILAASGGDGVVRLVDTTTGELIAEHDVVQVTPRNLAANNKEDSRHRRESSEKDEFLPRAVPSSLPVAKIQIEPSSIEAASLVNPIQLIVTIETEDGRRFDVTRLASFTMDQPIGSVGPFGQLWLQAAGTGKLRVEFRDKSIDVPVHISSETDWIPDYVQDVNPVLTRAGCNAGTCHGAKDGKNGFKLSLRGYDPIYDMRSLTDDHASRRVNLASPTESLMLLKATAGVPHEGGKLIDLESRYYDILQKWIAAGAYLNSDSPKVASISVSPKNPVVEQIGERQQFRVLATYVDGSIRDVTADAFLESGNTEVATISELHAGLLDTVRRGESPILVRYEGAYAATTLTVMGDRSGFEWQPETTTNRIDQLVNNKLLRTKTQPSKVADDYAFVRRVYLDLTGLPPSPEVIATFADDLRNTKIKRDELIDRLVGSEEFIDHWSNKWADLLQVNGKFLGREGATAFRQWIRKEVELNTPYDEFAEKILTASGSNRENPPSSYFKVLRTPEDTMENTTHLFLSTRFNCNKCHDHPFERWTQDQYYELAAYFAQVKLKADPTSGKRKVGGSAVEAGKPLFEIIADADQGEIKHDRTGQVTAPAFPYEIGLEENKQSTRRQQLAHWITSSENPYFARSYANRLWGYLLGVGIIEPIDDIRAGNPPSNPELLEYLTDELVQSNFDSQHLIKLICKSQTYQRSVATNKWNADDTINFSHAKPRRLPAEVLYDAVHRVTGTVSRLPGVPAGTRAAALPDSGIKLPDGFLDNLGRPARESTCECERVNEMQLGPVMAFVTGPTIGDAISNPKNGIAMLAASDLSDDELIKAVYLRILNRPPTLDEIQVTRSVFSSIQDDHELLIAKRDEYSKALSALLAKRELKRQQDVIRLTGELAAHRQSIASDRLKLENARKQSIAKSESELNKYEETLASTQADWEKQFRQGFTPWETFIPQLATTTIPGELITESDGSVVAKVKTGKGKYVLIGTPLNSKITAIRLEALPSDSFPAKGPGLADSGNFVLSELSANIVLPATDESEIEKRPIKFNKARANYSQRGYDVTTAIDGIVADRSNGWAVHGQQGKRHAAVFELAEPIELTSGQQLEFSLQQQHQDSKHRLGKFRISTTDAETPSDVALPVEVAKILSIPTDKRTASLTETLLEYRRQIDQQFQQIVDQLNKARAPVKPNAREQELQAALNEASQALPIDSRLQSLEAEVKLSESQLANLRLTAAQDLAWALINSPAFLYNH